MLRWGVLSTAKIGRDFVIPSLQQAANGTLAAIASRDLARAQALSAATGAPYAFGSYEEMLGSDLIDAVYIPLPTSQHVEWAVKAANAGKHVLVEKPLALKADDIGQVIAARDRNRVVIAEAFMVTYHPQWLKIRELVQGGAVGKLRHVQGAFTYHNVDPANMRNKPELGGGAIPDIGVYPTVTTRFVTGQEPQRVQARIDRDAQFGTDSYSSMKVDFGGFELTFYLSTRMAARQSMVFHGDKGWIEVTAPFNAGVFGDQAFTVWNQGHSEATTYRFPGASQYRNQAEAFARAVAGEPADIFTLEQSVLNQRVLDAYYRAGESDRWESV
ncbi:MAG: Gfo/Idh/MocA family oxidoreductase [Rhizobiaceae bacterium]|nr:Gfo/Idh/MocA family oxidoreductase [Rhizobiaceae bacterium]